jgi:hypothetical protein
MPVATHVHFASVYIHTHENKQYTKSQRDDEGASEPPRKLTLAMRLASRWPPSSPSSSSWFQPHKLEVYKLIHQNSGTLISIAM